MNAHPRMTSAREYVRTPDFIAGWREALRGLPPDYDARTSVNAAARYEVGRQMAIWMRAEGRVGKRPAPPSMKSIRELNRDTGLPRIVGVNA